MSKVAVVTGANKGIGYAIAKGLCEKSECNVYVTGRSVERVSAAVKRLNKLGLNPKSHQLDVTDTDSIIRVKEFMLKEHGGIDILVNNAAIAYPGNSTEPFITQAKETLKTNYYGLKNVCNILYPILRPHARVVNLSSSAGHLSRIPSEDLRKKFSNPDLTEPELDDLVEQFLKDVENGEFETKGWPRNSYSVSKVAVTALTRIQQKAFLEDRRPDIIVNAVHPGYVDTDMTHHRGILTIEQGAEAPIYAALLPENVPEPKGAYIWSNKQVVDWVKGPIP